MQLEMDIGSLPPVQMDDSSGVNHAMQLQEINRLRSQISRIRNKSQEAIIEGQVSPQRATESYRTVVSTYAMLFAATMQDEMYPGHELWNDRKICEVTIEPPTTVEIDGATGSVISASPASQTVSIGGIKDFIDSPAQFTAKFDVELDHPRCGRMQEEAYGVGRYTRKNIDAVVRELDRYKQTIGLGLQPLDEIGYESPEPV